MPIIYFFFTFVFYLQFNTKILTFNLNFLNFPRMSNQNVDFEEEDAAHLQFPKVIFLNKIIFFIHEFLAISIDGDFNEF